MDLAAFGEKEHFFEIKNNISLFNKKHDKNISIDFFEEIDDLLEQISNIKKLNIFLLHSEHFENILETTKKIFEINPNCKVVFCSKTDKFAVKGYKFNISFYLLIPIEFLEFEFILEKILFNEEKIIIKTNWQKVPIPINEICLIEKQGHNLLITTTNKKFSTRTTFKEFAKHLKDRKNFVNCIRGALVNLDWVDQIILQNFILKNGEKIPIRRQDRKKMKELLFAYKNSKNI